MKALLQTRMMGGDPPESFQVHLGQELIGTYVVAGQMEPLDTFYKDEGYDKVFPKQLIDIASYQGKPYSVPVNIHRSNMLWYNKKMFADVGVTEPPKDWTEFLAIGDKLKAKNLPLIGLAESGPGFTAHVFETIMIPTLGVEKFRGLFNGATKWDDPGITTSLETLSKMMDYANKDFLAVSWGDINDLMIGGKVATIIQGDWTPGVLWSKNFQDFGWAPAPGNKGVFQMLSDSFGLPKNVKNKEAALAWLKVCGSKAGQDAFNPAKGSIPARTDADVSKYTEYHKSAMTDWGKDTLLPSIVHGAAAKVSFMTDFMNAINVFATKKDVAQAQAALVKAANDAGFAKA
jgi:glucose/mannose transport system substrate-binding protein